MDSLVLLAPNLREIGNGGARVQDLERVVGALLALLRLLRDAAVDRLKGWARAGLDDDETRRTVEELLATLYLKAPTPKDRKRIRFYVDRWSREDQRFAVYATAW